MTNSPDERRKHLRIYRNFIVSYREKSKADSLNQVSQVNNVSKGGVSFSSTYPLKQGDILIVDLKAPFISDDIHLEGFVVDCREKVSGMIYEIRLQFQDVPEQVLAALDKIENYSKDQ